MELITPFMLFILGWHPEQPGELDLQRPQIVFLSAEECELAGAKMASRMTDAASDKSGARYEHRCIALPTEEEFDDAFKRLEESRQ